MTGSVRGLTQRIVPMAQSGSASTYVGLRRRRMRYGRYNHQGYFGESFVRVLASAAGLVAGKQDIDVTGVDFSFDFPGSRGT